MSVPQKLLLSVRQAASIFPSMISYASLGGYGSGLYSNYVKIIVLGDSHVNKTQFIENYKTEFQLHHSDAAKIKILSSDTKRFEVQITFARDYSQIVLSEVNDIEHADYSLSGATVCIICFSLADRVTWRHAREKWLTVCRQYCEGVPILLVGTNAEERDQIVKRFKASKQHTKQSKSHSPSIPPSIPTPPVKHAEANGNSHLEPTTLETPINDNTLVFFPPSQKEVTINDLPSEVLLRIVDFLKISDIYNFMMVSRLWHKVATCDYIWLHRPNAYIKKEEGKYIARVITQNAKGSFICSYQECSVKLNKGIKRVIAKAVDLAKKSVV